MSSESSNRDASSLENQLAWLTRHYMPDALWTVEGAFRFDRSLYHAAKALATTIGVRKINRVAGAPPCLWSLDWFSQGHPMPPQLYAQLLDAYTRHGVAVTLVFDNPFIRKEELDEPYARHLIAALMQQSCPSAPHAVSVASDSLAAHLHKAMPGLPLHCHVNRLLAAPPRETRSADFYKRLGGLYQRVCLHPADAVNPSLYTALEEPGRMDVIVNDPCLRSCPVRREHLQLLNDCRHAPFDVTLLQRRNDLLARAGCLGMSGSSLQQKRASTLTKAECRALYEAGYRSFIIQAQKSRNEMTLIWELCECMFDLPPELSHKQAALNTGLMLQLLPDTPALSSGLGDFTTTPYA